MLWNCANVKHVIRSRENKWHTHYKNMNHTYKIIINYTVLHSSNLHKIFMKSLPLNTWLQYIQYTQSVLRETVTLSNVTIQMNLSFIPLVEKSTILKTYTMQRLLTTLKNAAPTVCERVTGGKWTWSHCFRAAMSSSMAIIWKYVPITANTWKSWWLWHVKDV